MARQQYRLKHVAERGSALVYILIAIALLAALTVSFMEPSSQQTSGQNTFRAVSELSSQVDFVRSSIQECVMLFPGGDIGAIDDGAQKNQPYPLMPTDGYFTGCVGNGIAPNDRVAHLRCPGNPGDDPCHQPIFGGASGKFLPPPPALFGAWNYYAGDDGVFIWIGTDKTDPYIDSVLEKLNEGFSQCEADVVNATTTAQGLDSASPADAPCPQGHKCFRVRLLTKPSAVWNNPVSDQTGC